MAAIVAGALVYFQPQRNQSQQEPQSPQVSSGPSPTSRSGERALAGKVLAPPAHHVYWGDFRSGAPDDSQTMQSLRDLVGKWPAIQMWFQAWDGSPPFPTALANRLRVQGIVPLITWEPWKPFVGNKRVGARQPRYALRRIAAGAFDSYITRYAKDIKAYAGPVMLRPFHEMNGGWYPWGGTVNGNDPAFFIAAWRHVHDIFTKVGATNVTWVWSVNNHPERRINDYWPGKSYVDWIGLSGYNWGRIGRGNTWQDFDGVYAAPYADLKQYHKPIVLAEIAAPEVGGDKAKWITDSLRTMRSRYPLIAAFLWFDVNSEFANWAIDSSPQSLAAFRAGIAGPFVLSAPTANDSISAP